MMVPCSGHRSFNLTPSYQTDFDFDARIYSAQFAWQPYNVEIGLGSYNPVGFVPGVWLTWGLTLDADYRFVDEAGLTNLTDGSEYLWLGGVIDANLKIAPNSALGFVAVQTLSIRRLMDKAASKPARHVISLRRVLDDINAHRELITRENYVAYDGLSYDPEPGERAFMESLGKRGGGVHAQWLPTTGPQAWSVSQMVHERFDKLSGVARDRRSRSDVIDKLEAILAQR